MRKKQIRCGAKVIQRGDYFSPGLQPHLHAAQPGFRIVAEITSTVKRAVVDDVFHPAGSIVEDALTSHANTSAPCPVLANPEHLARAVNQLRQKLHPDDPTDLDFTIQDDHLPDDFLKADVQVGARRHLVFSTPEMLKYLAHAKRWYMDATFHVVKPPFTQLFSVHAFLHALKPRKYPWPLC